MMKKMIPPPSDGGIRQLMGIALPMVVSQACDTVMIFTDRLFVARIDPQLMNAVMGGGLTAFMMISFFMGLTGYTTALVAQHLGAAQKDKCALVLTQALIISAIAYPFILAMRPLAHRMFESMGVGAWQLGPQKLYFNILIYGVIVSLARNSLSGFFSGIGRTGIVMAATLTAMVSNIFFNYILIYGKLGFPALGIRGAAYGTVLGGVVGLLILCAAYFTKKHLKEFNIRESLRFDRHAAWLFLRFGTPTGIELFLNIFAFNILVMVFHSHGPETAIAATVMFNWDLVSFVPLLGIEIGVTSLVGRSMGAKKPDIAHRSTISGLKVGMVYSIILFILFVGFPALLASVFRPSGAQQAFEAAMPLAVFMIRMASLYVIVDAAFVVFIGALRGAGDTLWAMIVSVSMNWVVAGALFAVMRVFGFSPRAGWTTAVILYFAFTALVFLRYNTGKWRSITIVGDGRAQGETYA